MVNGHKIREMREAADLSGAEFAAKTGTSQTMLSHIENGFKQPSVALLKRIADYFGCTVDDLLEVTEGEIIAAITAARQETA